jgi:hypothetical protein
MTELLPCPFCGSPAVYSDKGWGEGKHIIHCSKKTFGCILCPRMHERIVDISKEMMFKIWNTRNGPSYNRPSPEARGVRESAAVKEAVIALTEAAIKLQHYRAYAGESDNTVYGAETKELQKRILRARDALEQLLPEEIKTLCDDLYRMMGDDKNNPADYKSLLIRTINTLSSLASLTAPAKADKEKP